MKNKINKETNEQLKKDLIRTYGNMCLVDGILNLDKYNNAPIQVMWILNEPNYGEEYEGLHSSDVPLTEDEISSKLKEFNEDIYFSNVSDPDHGYAHWMSTFKLISYVTYGVLHGIYLWDKLPDIDDSAKINGEYMVDKIALVNIKKVPGDSQASPSEINNVYRDNKEFLHHQINTINPQIVFNGSKVDSLMNELTDEIPSIPYNNFYYKDTTDRLVINTYHPNQRTISHKQYVDDNLLIVKKFLENKGLTG